MEFLVIFIPVLLFSIVLFGGFFAIIWYVGKFMTGPKSRVIDTVYNLGSDPDKVYIYWITGKYDGYIGAYSDRNRLWQACISAVQLDSVSSLKELAWIKPGHFVAIDKDAFEYNQFKVSPEQSTSIMRKLTKKSEPIHCNIPYSVGPVYCVISFNPFLKSKQLVSVDFHSKQ